MRILLARHPETRANVSRTYAGSRDSRLSALGREQSHRLVDEIASWGPDVVVSSPAGRARHVARDAAFRAGVTLVVDSRLREIGLGQVEGLTFDEARRRGLRIDASCSEPHEAPFAGGEPWGVFVARTGAALAAAVGRGERVAVVTHAGPLRASLVELLGLAWSSGWRFSTPPASLLEFEFDPPKDGGLRGGAVLVGLDRC
jgi:broad specificity phosphatase PhoE